MNSPRLDRKAVIDKDLAAANRQRRVIEFDDVHEEGPPNAVSVSLSSLSIQSW